MAFKHCCLVDCKCLAKECRMSFQNAVIICFLSLFFLSISAYFYRDQVSILEKMAQDTSHFQPRIRTEGFILRRYEHSSQSAQLSADHASLRPPRTLLMAGSVRGWQLGSSGEKDIWQAERFDGELNSGKLEVLSREGELRFVELSNRVVIVRSRYTLYTDKAYYAVNEKVYGSEPVRVVSALRWLTAESGFEVNFEEDSFRLFGQVKGVLYPDK